MANIGIVVSDNHDDTIDCRQVLIGDDMVEFYLPDYFVSDHREFVWAESWATDNPPLHDATGPQALLYVKNGTPYIESNSTYTKVRLEELMKGGAVAPYVYFPPSYNATLTEYGHALIAYAKFWEDQEARLNGPVGDTERYDHAAAVAEHKAYFDGLKERVNRGMFLAWYGGVAAGLALAAGLVIAHAVGWW